MSIRKSIERKNTKVTLIYNGNNLEDRLTYAELKRIIDLGYDLRGFDVSARNIPKKTTKKLVDHLKANSKRDIVQTSQFGNQLPYLNLIDKIAEDSRILVTPIIIRNGKAAHVDVENNRLFEKFSKETKNGVSNSKEESGFFYSAGNVISRQLAYLFLLFTLLFGLRHHLSDQDQTKNQAYKEIQLEESQTDINFSDF